MLMLRGRVYGRMGKKRRAAPAVGGGALLESEANGFATDFLYATDASRVALKASSAITYYAVDSFYTNAGTSPKMVYDSAGVLGWSPHNYMLQSQTFDHATWSGNALNVTANAIAAPDGTMTADAFIPPVAGASSYRNQAPTVTSGTVVTFSVYIKNGTLDTPWFAIQSDTSAWFNLATGIKGTTSGGAISSNMVAVGSGWYRCDMTFTAASGTPQVYLTVATADGAGAGVTGGDGVKPAWYLWGAQMNRGAVPTAYLPTTTAARYGLAIDYDPVTHAAKGLLCEPAATNMHPWSNDLSVLAIEGGTATLNNQAGPDGSLTADTFTEDTGGGTVHAGYGTSIFTANIDHTVSRFIKMGTRRYATLGWSNGVNGAYAVYDLQSGVVGSAAAIAAGVLKSASMQALPNGWYRCILSAQVNATNMYWTCGAATAATITPDGYGRQIFTGTSATLFFWGAQVEAGTVATSPIPTLTATVTRAADLYNVTPASINYSATAGSWWVENYLLNDPNDRVIIGTNSGSGLPLYYNNSAYQLGTPQLYKLGPNVVLNVNKSMSAFQAGDRAVTFNGLAPSIDAGATAALLGPTIIYFGNGSSGPAMIGYIRKVRYLPRRPSNTELQTMTT